MIVCVDFCYIVISHRSQRENLDNTFQRFVYDDQQEIELILLIG